MLSRRLPQSSAAIKLAARRRQPALLPASRIVTSPFTFATSSQCTRFFSNTPPKRAGPPGGGGGFPFPGMSMPGQQQSKPGETLKQFTTDLTEMAHEGRLDPVIGRSDEIRRITQILARRTKSNPVCVGEAGTGKSAIIEGLAQRIARDEVPAALQGKKVLALDLAALMGGTGVRGEFETRMKNLLEDLQKEANQSILFVDEIHMLFGLGKAEGSLDAGNMLKPLLARGLQVCGATTYDEYRKTIEKDAALARRFQPVQVHEPSIEATIAILRGLRPRYEIHHGVTVSDAALVAAASFASRYMSTERKLPDSAIDLVDEAMSALRLQQESKPERLEVIERDIMTLQIELESLRKETDEFSMDRRKVVEKRIAEKTEDFGKLSQIWHEERARLEKLKDIKAQIEDLKLDLEKAERDRDFQRIAEIRYGKIPEVERQKQEAEDALSRRSQEKQDAEEDESTSGILIEDKVTAESIAAVVSRQVGVPIRNLLRGERERLLHMEEALRNRVKGQDEALTAIAETVRLSRAQLQNDRKPASLLLLGGTGVGKTEAAKALSSFLFDDEKSLIQINLSEYSEAHSISRLIGAMPGYVGHEEGGQLTEQVRRRPYSVVLFDELEKASRQVQMALLQILDEGRLTDSQGRNISFRNCIILATSNLGAEVLYDPKSLDSKTGRLRPDVKDKVLKSVQLSLAPELINRFDDQLVFNKLSQEDLKQIVELRISEIEKRLSAQRISIQVSDQVRDWLAEKGYDRIYGARPLNRVIRRYLLNPLAKGLISNQIKNGDAVPVTLSEDKEKLEFQFLHRGGVDEDAKSSSQEQSEGEKMRDDVEDGEINDLGDSGDGHPQQWRVVEPGGRS
ncbi:unnamed protein product [Sympodiomycopsis kandeliae]